MKRTAPLAVVLGVLIDEDKLLVIKRDGGTYDGLMALPGGKVENDEHLPQAAIREIEEESGIQATYEEHLATVSELLTDGEHTQHYLLHLIRLTPAMTNILHTPEGDVTWESLETIEEHQDLFVPSDWLFIEEIVKKGRRGYYECDLKKEDDNYTLQRFEQR